MRYSCVTFAAALASFANVCQGQSEFQDSENDFDVDDFLAGPAPHSVTHENFDAVVDNRDYVVVNFCDATSVVCTNFANKWKDLASDLKDVVFLTVDISVETELSERFQAFESPTLIFFGFSEPESHDAAAFDKPALTEWITESKVDVVQDKPPSLEPVPGISSFTLYARQRKRDWCTIARRYHLMGDFHYQPLKEDSKEGVYRSRAVLVLEFRVCYPSKGFTKEDMTMALKGQQQAGCVSPFERMQQGGHGHPFEEGQRKGWQEAQGCVGDCTSRAVLRDQMLRGLVLCRRQAARSV